jgi:hypothetical protein
MKQPPPNWNDYSQGPDFDRARIGIATPFQYYDIDLTTAAENRMIDISGDFLYFDTADGFDGIITLELNNEHNAPLAPFTGRQGFALNALFKRIKCSWAAQPGKKVRIMYSTGERVIPALTGTIDVTNTVQTDVEPRVYGSAYKSYVELAANTPDTVFTQAANVNGAIVHRCHFFHANGGGAGCVNVGFYSRTAPPASPVDGDYICGVDSASGVSSAAAAYTGKLETAIYIPPGKGLWFISELPETFASRSCLYTLL